MLRQSSTVGSAGAPHGRVDMNYHVGYEIPAPLDRAAGGLFDDMPHSDSIALIFFDRQRGDNYQL